MNALRSLRNHAVANMQVYAAMGLAAGVGLGVMPQTVFLYKYREALANYTKTGDEESVSPALQRTIEELALTTGLKEEEEANLHVFMAYGHDTIHRGSLKMKSGAILGIPAFFSFRTVEDVAKQQFQLNMKTVDWSSEGGQMLMSSLVLSDHAKRFAIAREMEYTKTNPLFLRMLLQTGCFSAAYLSGYAGNVAFDLRGRLKGWARVSLYGILGTVGLGLYLSIHDFYMCTRDKKADKNAAKLGQAYAEGGVEYYNKMLLRRQALRILLGPQGPSMYTPYGNEVFGLRTPHVQCSQRRDNVAAILQEFRKKDTDKELLPDDSSKEVL